MDFSKLLKIIKHSIHILLGGIIIGVLGIHENLIFCTMVHHFLNM